jgi:hypothetical protein
VKEILEAMIASGGGRFRGIRFISASRPDQAQWGSVVGRPEKRLLDKRVREGFAQLAPLGLSFDAFMYHTQLGDLIDLARLSGNSDRPEPCRWPDRAWPLQGQMRRGIRRLECQHPRTGVMPQRAREARWPRHSDAWIRCARRRAASELGALAAAWRPYIETCITAFGADRLSVFCRHTPLCVPKTLSALIS